MRRIEIAQLQRLLVLGRVARHRLVRRPAVVGDHHVDRTVDRLRHPARGVGGGEAGHAATFGQQVGDQDDRPAHLRQRFLDAAHEQRRHQAGEEAAGADDDGVEAADRLGDRRMNRDRRLEPEPPHLMPARLPRVDFDFARATRCRRRTRRTSDRRLDADRPDAAPAAEQAAQAVDGGEEVAAVLLHHRQQQVAAGVAGQAVVLLERRQPRQQHAARFAFVARQRERALQHVARRQHAQLVAQLPGAAAAVEHRDDGVQVEPGIGLQAAEQTRQSGAAAEAADVQLAQMHCEHCTTVHLGTVHYESRGS